MMGMRAADVVRDRSAARARCGVDRGGGRRRVAAVYTMLQEMADHTTCVLTPQHLFSIAAWYADLTEPTDADIRQMLVTAAQNVMVLQRSNFLPPRVDS